MNRILWNISLITLLFFGACNPQEFPEEEDNDAIFYFKGQVNGETVAYYAGDDLYYMRASYSDDTLGIRSYIGRIGLKGCETDPACANSIQVNIREIENGRQVPIEDNIFPSAYDYRGPASYLFDRYKATFTSHSYPYGMNHTWDLGDGNVSYDTSLTHYYLSESDSVVDVTLTTYNSSNGASSTLTNELDFYAGCYVNIYRDITYTPSPNYNLRADPGAPFTTTESNYGSGWAPISSNPFPSDSNFLAHIRSTFTADGCVAEKKENICFDSTKAQSVANFNYVLETETVKDVRDYSEVSVIWQDDNGKVYSSDKYDQPGGNYFEVLDVEEYNQTSDGYPTKKYTAKFKVRLYGDSETDFVEMTSEKSVFAIAYEEL